MIKVFFASIFIIWSLNSVSQQLMINEVSQGSGSSEYVELVVIGNAICNNPVPCIDLRKVIIDDNNGFFGQGTGTGIAGGALRFSNDPLWSCVPQGTFIVVYNEASPNTALPADDISLSDGNCTLVIPGNSALLESTTTSPTANPFNPLYPDDSFWGPSAGWASVSMNNSNDSFQIPNLGVNGTPLHSVSWGNNTTGAIIYFDGSASNSVMSFKNLVSNDFNDQANWVSEDVSTGQTPGVANNSENDAWIGTMNPNCRITPTLSFTIVDASCTASNGSATLNINNIVNPIITWELDGSNGNSISNLAPGSYPVSVVDNSTSCIILDTAIIGQNDGGLSANLTSTDESCTGLCDGTISHAVSGGQTPYVIQLLQNGNVIPEQNNYCPQSYELQVTDDNGCVLNETFAIGTINTINYSFSNDTLICLSDSINLSVVTTSNVSWSTGQNSNVITVKPSVTSNFSFTITEGTCVLNESIIVSVKDCNEFISLTFPNIFTPNDDNNNDFFVPITYEGIKNLQFVILNRWGGIMYETDSQAIKWDGKFNGKDASEGVYFYKFNYTELNSEVEKQAHGFLHLERK